MNKMLSIFISAVFLPFTLFYLSVAEAQLPNGTRLTIEPGSFFEVLGFTPATPMVEGADGLVLGTVVAAPSGSFHLGPLDGNPGEQGGIVASYFFLGNTGTFWTESPIVDLGGGLIDMSGWKVAWAGEPIINFDNPDGLFTVTGDSYILGYDGIVSGGPFNGVAFMMHLEGNVHPPNQAPDCTQANPSTETILVSNHKFLPINIIGVTDPDGDPVIITIENIFQDELVNGLGDGNFSPDGAGVGTSTAEVRAEVSGNENGRVYHIGFGADDGQGGVCTGEVVVGVPHDQSHDAVDDGSLYDSTIL